MLIRNIILMYDGEQHTYKIEEKTDSKAILKAIHKLEEELHKVRGGLVRYFKENQNDISLRV